MAKSIYFLRTPRCLQFYLDVFQDKVKILIDEFFFESMNSPFIGERKSVEKSEKID